jgi:hypothetical protein
MAWLDWEVRFVRPSWEANGTTWNLGPLGQRESVLFIGTRYSMSIPEPNCNNCYKKGKLW